MIRFTCERCCARGQSINVQIIIMPIARMKFLQEKRGIEIGGILTASPWVSPLSK
jgi:hypothetical protein